jgi:hypothetical protein
VGFIFKPFNTKGIQDSLQSVTRELLTPSNMKRYGQMAADMIRLRTRLGSSVSAEGADKEPLKPLAESTKKERKRLQSKGKLSSLTSPGKSNLTRSAQLLDSVQVTRVESTSVVVGPKGPRSDSLTNEKVGEYVSQAGRPFNFLSSVEIKRINDEIKRNLRQIIERLLTKTK